MSTTLEPFVPAPEGGGLQRFVARGLSWSSYRKFADALDGRHVRLTYDRGLLELMTISPEHAYLSRVFSQMVVILAKAAGMKRRSCGDMTCDREDLDRGFEPDECFYLVNEPLVRGKMRLDLAIDPPPDLGIEVDLTTHVRNRLALYAALRIPEVWRYRNDRVTFHRLQADGQYANAETSGIFPFLKPADIEAVLNQRTTVDEETLLDQFQAWATQAASAGAQ